MLLIGLWVVELSNQIMHYGLVLTVILITINATLIVGAGLLNQGNVFSTTKLGISDYGVNDYNNVNPNDVKYVQVQPEEETNTLLSLVSGLVSAIPFVGDVVKWLGEVKNLVVNLLFGYLVVLQLIGLPDSVRFIIAAVLAPIQTISILWVLFNAVSSLSGGTI